METPHLHRVVVIGGGFGGLSAVKSLAAAPVAVTLIDKRNFHLFQPLLYQVATGGLSAANISSPLREILKNQKNARVILGEVVGFDIERRMVKLADADIPFDSLIVATGSSHDYFGHSEWAQFAPGLKTIENATDIRRKILLAFELAEKSQSHEERMKLLTFVIVGAGPTGVEMAGAIAELSKDTFRNNFRSINPAEARIILIDGLPKVLPSYPDKLSAHAAEALGKLGVEVRVGVVVKEVREDGIVVHRGTEDETILARTVVWAAGVKASPLGHLLSQATGAPLDRRGAVMVEPDLSIPRHPHIYVIGDLAHFAHQTRQPLPGVAPVAIQEGKYVGGLIAAHLRGWRYSPFHYIDRGKMATIGRTKAVADLNCVAIGGPVAWFVWLFIHLMGLVSYENRLLVFMQWAYNYFTRNRQARLITEEFSK